MRPADVERHETHVCRDCDAEITMPYAKPPSVGEVVSTQAEPLSPDALLDWLRQTVVDGYHGVNPHHSFAECGDPFCADAQVYLAQIETVLAADEARQRVVDAARAVLDWADGGQCKWCLRRGGSLFSAHGNGCPVGEFRAALNAFAGRRVS